MEILHHDLHHYADNNLGITVPSRSCDVYNYTRCTKQCCHILFNRDDGGGCNCALHHQQQRENIDACRSSIFLLSWCCSSDLQDLLHLATVITSLLFTVLLFFLVRQLRGSILNKEIKMFSVSSSAIQFKLNDMIDTVKLRVLIALHRL